MKYQHAVFLSIAALTTCAGSTSSVLIPAMPATAPKVAILPLDGPLGAQAVDLISEELAKSGIQTAERADRVATIAVDTDLSPAEPATVRSYSNYGAQLGVRYLFAGTVSAVHGPLYSYAHVNMTLRLIDARTGQTRWIGKYGDSHWSSAISTQGDLQRGARNMVKEFIKSGGAELLNH